LDHGYVLTRERLVVRIGTKRDSIITLHSPREGFPLDPMLTFGNSLDLYIYKETGRQEKTNDDISDMQTNKRILVDTGTF